MSEEYNKRQEELDNSALFSLTELNEEYNKGYESAKWEEKWNRGFYLLMGAFVGGVLVSLYDLLHNQHIL